MRLRPTLEVVDHHHHRDARKGHLPAMPSHKGRHVTYDPDRSTAMVALGLIIVVAAAASALLLLSIPLIDDDPPATTTTAVMPLAPLPAVDRAMP